MTVTQSGKVVRYLKESQSQYSRIIVSSVVQRVNAEITAVCSSEKLFLFKNKHIPVGRISYESYEVMGVDRFLAATGAWMQSRSAVIIIDAGTACTIDYADQEGVFQGGVIMPGLKALEQSLLHKAPALPAIENYTIPDEWPPKKHRLLPE